MPTVATFYDVKILGSGLDAHDLNGLSDPYFVIKVPTNITTSEDNPQNEEEEPIDVNFSDSRTGAIIISSAKSRVHKVRKSSHDQTKGYREIYESEVVHKNLNPQWDAFRVGLYEISKGNLDVEILIECYDWDRIGKSDFIGSFKIPVKTFISLRNDANYTILSKSGKSAGQLNIQTISSDSNIIFCEFETQAANLTPKDSNGLSDPYFVIKSPLDMDEYPSSLALTCLEYNSKTRVHNTEGYRCVYESPIIKKNLNPKWPRFRLGYYDLCRSMPQTPLLIECYDYNKYLSHKLIGSAEITLQTLLETKESHPILLKDKTNNNTGILYLLCHSNSPSQILCSDSPTSPRISVPTSPRFLLPIPFGFPNPNPNPNPNSNSKANPPSPRKSTNSNSSTSPRLLPSPNPNSNPNPNPNLNPNPSPNPNISSSRKSPLPFESVVVSPFHYALNAQTN